MAVVVAATAPLLLVAVTFNVDIVVGKVFVRLTCPPEAVTLTLIVSTFVTATPSVSPAFSLSSKPSVARVIFSVSEPKPPSIAAVAPTSAVSAEDVIVSSFVVS